MASQEEPYVADKLSAELQSYLDLPHGWDGCEGVPAPFDAVADTLAFFEMRPQDIPLPYPQIGSDGEVSLYWRTQEVFAEVSFFGDGEYSYHARYTHAEDQPMSQARDDCRVDADDWDYGLLLVLNKIVR